MENPIHHLLKILVIDDDEQNTTMLSKFLSAKGFEIIITNDPLDGLNLIRVEKFDLILLDVNMPVISGFGIIELLAGENTLKNQNILIFSGNPIPAVQLKNLLRRDGINGFMKKPIKLDELLSIILK